MKASIHPQYFPEALITCACGSVLKVGATKEAIQVEICSKCHPFFTGEQRFTDTEGKLERFQKRVATAKVHAPELAKKKAKKAGMAVDRPQKSLKEMLMGQ